MNNKKKWIIWTVILLLATNLITFYGSSIYSTYLPNGKVIVSRKEYNKLNDLEQVMKNNNDLNKLLGRYDGVLKYDKLFDIREKLYKSYDGKIDEDALVEGAIKGMTSALNDPYTVFMNKKEYESFNTQTEGTYTGLGLQVGVKDDKIIVIAPFEDSPAKKAGILTGDIITKVDGKDVSGKDLETAVSLMKGKENTSVTLTIERPNKGSFDVEVNRAKITLNTVKGEMIGDIGYVQLLMFDENTGESFKNTLKELKSKNMKGLILDLRGNPGGLLTTCMDVTSNFVPKDKVIVSTIDKYKDETKYKSKGGENINVPLVVLVDEGTASASEILSGAIRDYELGTLVGQNTFGKGVVQTIIEDKKDGTALKVTISKYYTPKGENINHKGIKPDVEVKYPAELKEKPYDRSVDPQFNKAMEIIKKKTK